MSKGLFAFILFFVPILPAAAQTGRSTFTESFGNSSNLCWSGGPSSCDQLWVAQGSPQSIVATPGSPPPNTAGANSLQMMEPAGTGSYIYTTGTFPRIPAGMTFDLFFTLDVTSKAMQAHDTVRLLAPCQYSNGWNYPAEISFGYDGTNLQLQAAGSSSASSVNISLNAWHTVQLHVAPGTNASYIVVDGGAQNTFTENAWDFEYLEIGSSAAWPNFDALTYYIGNVYVNSALGGGPPPSAYIDFENSSDGTALTADILAASTHCGNGTWSLSGSPLTGMTISTNGQKQLPSPVTTCGVQYGDAMGTRGMQYDMAQTAELASYTWSTTSNSASVGFFFKITISDNNYYSAFAIFGGNDYAMLNIHNGTMALEAKAGDSSGIPLPPNVWYWVTMQFNGGGTHYMQVYDTTSWALLGSMSVPSTGNYQPGGIAIGRDGSEAGFPSAYWYYDNVVIDYVTAKFPIVPGAPKSLVSIAVTPANPSIAKGATQQFTATGTYSDGSTQNLTNSVSWTSSNTSLSTISNTGLASGVGPGSSTIQATSGSVTGSTTLNVTAATVLSSIAVTPTNPSIAKGSTQQFTATGRYSDGSTQNLTNSVSWTSSNTSVGTISNTGLASGVGPGSSTIQATSGSVTGSTTLTVTTAAPVLKSLAVTPANSSASVGTSVQFKASGTYSDGSTKDITSSVSWSSSNTFVATINSTSGLAAARGQGTTTIQAASGTISGTTSLTVTASADFTIAVTPTSETVNRGMTGTYTVTITQVNGPSTVNLSVRGLPSGTSGSFNPSSVTSSSTGATSTLKVTVSSSATSGQTTTSTVRGSNGNFRHSRSVQITVN
jgi:hypothetical protein